LAAQGLRFTDAHSSSGVCTPTRYSLLTGRYHWRTRLQKGVLGGFSLPLIRPGRATLGSLLQGQGYHTACFGKWHLGMEWPLKDGRVADDEGQFSQPFADVNAVDYEADIRGGPVDSGFDTFYGISASLDMFPYVWIRDRRPTEVGSEIKAFHRPGPAGKAFEAIDVQGEITDRTIQYIAERAAEAKQGRPFFAYVPLAAPHTPIVPTAEWQGKSGINAYADFVMQVDADLGRVMAALEAHGLAENTLLIFTSDNGCSPQGNFPQLQAAGHEPSYHFRGHKADLYEGGQRVPFVLRWPAVVKAGTVTDQLVGQWDLMATFAEMLDTELAEDQGEDSVSFYPVLTGRAQAPVRRHLISQSIDGSFALRDGPWKLLLCPGSGGWSYPKPGKDDTQGLPPVQLYHLGEDPGETENRVEQEAERAAAMRSVLEDQIHRGRSTPGRPLENDVQVSPTKP
jgi:arylsulfatase A-like enzyme